MAVHGPDYKLIIDRDGNGAVKRTLELVQEHPLNTGNWSAERAAAATSLASWLSWLQTNDQAGYTWISGLSSTDQEGLRQALLSGS